jgi:hypothetical protein
MTFGKTVLAIITAAAILLVALFLIALALDPWN